MWNLIKRAESDLQCSQCNGLFDFQMNKKYEATGLFRSDKEDYVYAEYGGIFCSRFCAKDYYRKLVDSGEIKEMECHEGTMMVMKDKSIVDMAGDPIWFPADNRPYYDQALCQTFHNIHEKKKFMDQHKIISNGSFDGSNSKLEKRRKEASEKAFLDVKNRNPALLEKIERRNHNGKRVFIQKFS